MTGSDRTSEAADAVDPWAPGGAMAPVPPARDPGAPLSFTSVDATPRDAAPGRPHPPRGFDTPVDNTVATTSTDRRPWRGGGTGAALAVFAAVTVVAVVATVALSGADDPVTPPSATAAELEPLPTQPLDRVTQPTAPRPTPPPLLADSAAPSAANVVPDAASRQFVVDVAADLSSIEPTEIVAIVDVGSESNELYEISLPSGRVRATAVPGDLRGAQLAVNDGGAVLWPIGDGALAIGSAGTVTFVAGRTDAMSWAPGSDATYLWGAPSGSADAEVRLLDLGEQSIALERATWLDTAEGPAELVDFDGALLRADAGGTYRITSTEVTRLTSGDVVSSGANHLLLRECDEVRRCGLIALDRFGGRTEWAVDLPVGFAAQLVGGLSPGGDALLVFSPRAAADAARSLWSLELVDGTVRPLRTPPSREVVAAWDTAGTGVLVADSVLIHIDRFSGRSLVVSDDLPALRDVATRRPATTPLCEVLAIALPRFAEMRAAGADNSLSPPSDEVLRRIAALASDELATTVAPLVTFLSAFVSAEVADSQTVANWPANVRSGLEALESLGASECPLIVQT